MHWINTYTPPLIGRPWVQGAEGPDVFDCGGLVRFIQREHFGRDIPPIDVETIARFAGASFALASIRVARSGWHEVAQQIDGDGVLLRDSTDTVHVGIWLDVDGGGVLHCVEGMGVMFEKLSVIRYAWGRPRFFRFEEGRPF